MKLIRIATEAIECTLHNAHTHIHTCTRTVYQSTKAELSSKTTEKRIKRNSDDFRLMSKDLLVDRWSFRNELEWKMPVCIRTVACVCVWESLDCVWTQTIDRIRIQCKPNNLISFIATHHIYTHTQGTVERSLVSILNGFDLYAFRRQLMWKNRIVISFKIRTHRKKKKAASRHRERERTDWCQRFNALFSKHGKSFGVDKSLLLSSSVQPKMIGSKPLWAVAELWAIMGARIHM